VANVDAIRLPLAAVAEAAYLRGVSLSAQGFYRTPDIFYDRNSGKGRPFHYYAYGACVSEVEIDVNTGMKRVLRIDILHDVGDSLHPAIDRGQIEGAFVQGMGWLTAEDLAWSPSGRLLSHSASTYAIPTIGDAPADFRVALFRDERPHSAPDVVHGSKAVGEPPLMLALSVRHALLDALQTRANDAPSPLTHETLRRIMDSRD
jgi:xanthine dehydrogenase molybdopterin-binding subunit B